MTDRPVRARRPSKATTKTAGGRSAPVETRHQGGHQEGDGNQGDGDEGVGHQGGHQEGEAHQDVGHQDVWHQGDAD